MSIRPKPPSSPCVKLCTLDAAQRLCLGCFRTIDEIAAWSGLGEAERQAVMAALPARRVAAAQQQQQQ